MHLVPKVSCLESLLAIKMKMEIKIFQQSRDPMMVTRSKGHVCESLALCQHLASWGLDTYSAGGDMFFICHVKQQDRSVQISCVSMGESSYRMSPHWKDASSKTSYKYVITLKNWHNCITARYILRRSAQK